VLRDRTGSVRGYLPYLSFDLPLFFRLLFRAFDLVVAEPPPTTGLVVRVVCALRRRPFAYYAADVLSDAAAASGSPSAVVGVVRRIERGVLRRAAVVLSVSPGVTERVRQLGAARVAEVGNGVDLTPYLATESRPIRSPPMFTYAGTASEIQGAVVFAEAIRVLRREGLGVTATFIGGGTDWARIAEIANELPGVIELRDWATQEEVAALLVSSVASLASIREGIGYDFALPTKMSASLACGTPVIFAGPKAGREFVERFGGGIGVPHELDAVADAMRRTSAAPASAGERARVAEEVRSVVSLESVAARAAEAVESAALS
jgi:glycosyltransferase involved in cell wall biosynthesis